MLTQIVLCDVLDCPVMWRWCGWLGEHSLLGGVAVGGVGGRGELPRGGRGEGGEGGPAPIQEGL